MSILCAFFNQVTKCPQTVAPSPMYSANIKEQKTKNHKKSELSHLIKSERMSAHPRNFTNLRPRHDCASITQKKASPDRNRSHLVGQQSQTY